MLPDNILIMADSGFDIHSKCRICLSGYTEPRLLDCFHKFCTPCIEKLIEGKVKFNCPLCRADIIVSKEGVSDFGICMDDKQAEHCKLCELCDDGNFAVVKCLDCDEFLCKNCHKSHQKLKALKDHTYEFLADSETATSGSKDSIKTIYKPEIETCDIHNENLSLFCKPCNRLICRVCCTNVHKQHEVILITRAATCERDILMAAIGGLTAKVPILNNTIEIAKTEEETYYKHSRQVKQEIITYAAGLKEVFCKTVDIIKNNNLEAVDQIQKSDIKQIGTFIDETETDKLSFAGMLQTTNELVQHSSDKQLLNLSTNLKRRLNSALQQPGKCLKLNNIQYTSSELNKDHINAYAGYVKRVEVRDLKTSFRALPIPDLQTVKDFRQISTFGKGATSLAADINGSVWLLKKYSCGLYTKDGKLQQNHQNINVGQYSRLVKSADGTVLLWLQNSACRLSPKMEQENKLFQVPFDNGIACCFVNNGNLLVYNVTEKSFVVVSEGNEILQEIKRENLSNILSSGHLYAAQTKTSNIIITQNSNVIVINENGDIVNKSTSNRGCNLQDVCIDKYENVFVSEYRSQKVLLYCPEGNFQREALDSGLLYPYLTIDDCGNLWMSDQNNTRVYSYI